MDMPVADSAVEHVRRPDEPGHERRPRLVVDLGGRADLLDPALVHHHDLVRQLQGLLLVVRHQQARHAELAVELVEPAAEVLADLGIEGPERLVEQEHLGRGASARERDPLPLAAGQLVRVAAGESPSWTSSRARRPALPRGVRLLADRRPNATFCATVMCRNRA